MSVRRVAALGVLLALVAVGCGGESPTRSTAPSIVAASPGDVDALTGEPLDPAAAEAVCASTSPRYGTIAEDQADFDRLLARSGDRPDFRVPPAVLGGLPEGRLTLQIVVRPFLEGIDLDDVRAADMAPGVRDAYALYLADVEILNGGFAQMWGNHPGLGRVLPSAARRMGLPQHAALFTEAERIRRSDGDTAAIDDRFAAFQEGCDVSLAVAVAREVRERPRDFLAG